MQAEAPYDSEMRRRSVGTVEIADGKGRRKTVQLEDLSSEDRALAEKFGYKPVSRQPLNVAKQ